MKSKQRSHHKNPFNDPDDPNYFGWNTNFYLGYLGDWEKETSLENFFSNETYEEKI